jgi:hypothetical protein
MENWPIQNQVVIFLCIYYIKFDYSSRFYLGYTSIAIETGTLMTFTQITKKSIENWRDSFVPFENRVNSSIFLWFFYFIHIHFQGD